MQWSCQPQAKLLQQSPENVSRIARADLFSLHPEFSPLLAESAAASFKRVHFITVEIIIWTASMRIYMLFVSMEELVLGVRCVLALQAARVGLGQSFAAPPQLLPLVVATRCSILAAYGDTIGN